MAGCASPSELDSSQPVALGHLTGGVPDELGPSAAPMSAKRRKLPAISLSTSRHDPERFHSGLYIGKTFPAGPR